MILTGRFSYADIMRLTTFCSDAARIFAANGDAVAVDAAGGKVVALVGQNGDTVSPPGCRAPLRFGGYRCGDTTWDRERKLCDRCRPARAHLPMLCRYNDCAEGHPVAGEDDTITCATCRKELGLPEINQAPAAVGGLDLSPAFARSRTGNS